MYYAVGVMDFVLNSMLTSNRNISISVSSDNRWEIRLLSCFRVSVSIHLIYRVQINHFLFARLFIFFLSR